MNQKIKILIGIGLGLLAIAGIFFVVILIGWLYYMKEMSVVMKDETIIANFAEKRMMRIEEVLKENKQVLLEIPGVVGAGITATKIYSPCVEIAVYVEEGADLQKIPRELAEFFVIVKKINEATEMEKEGMIIRK